jgi:hypothetical protein
MSTTFPGWLCYCLSKSEWLLKAVIIDYHFLQGVFDKFRLQGR